MSRMSGSYVWKVMEETEIYNTNIICNKCGKCIKSNEAFIPVKYGYSTQHYPNCEHPLEPEKTRPYVNKNAFYQEGWDNILY